MILGKVIGTVTATAKHREYLGHKIMVVQPINATGAPAGPSLLAVDTVQAGPGDTVLVLQEGNGIRQILQKEVLPIQKMIVGIVDAVERLHDHS